MLFKTIITKNVFTKFIPIVFMFSFFTREVNSEWNTRDYMKREHSLLKPYQGKMFLLIFKNKSYKNGLFIGSGITVPNWDFMGSTIVTDKYVRLTPDLQSKSGSIWNSVVSI